MERLGDHVVPEPDPAEQTDSHSGAGRAAAFLARDDLGEVMLQCLAEGARKAALENEALRARVAGKA